MRSAKPKLPQKPFGLWVGYQNFVKLKFIYNTITIPITVTVYWPNSWYLPVVYNVLMSELKQGKKSHKLSSLDCALDYVGLEKIRFETHPSM